MNEFTLKESMNKLIGSPAGYVGYEEESILEDIRNYPYSVLILDEIDKAHPAVINFFLNILDEGYCIDNKGNKIRFDNVIIIMTTNSIITSKSVGFNNKTKLCNYFSKEFLNRIDEIIEFKPLNDSDINRFIYSELEKYNKRHICNLDLSIDDINDIKNNSNIKEYGVRKLNRNIRKLLDNKLINLLFI